jgi:hypothetical protein
VSHTADPGSSPGLSTKSNILGMRHSKAQHDLRRSVMFMLVQKCGMDTCYRCEKRIEAAGDLSIDHKESWQFAEDPVAAFFDLKGIAFSHKRCNCAATTKPTKVAVEHGTTAGYEYGCRCEPCRQARRKYNGRYMTDWRKGIRRRKGPMVA